MSRGAEALQAYLGDLYEALPSLTLIAQSVRSGGPCAGVDAEFSGVNSGGIPFDAFAEMQFCVVDGKIRKVTAEVQRVSFGQDLLTDPGSDPRRFFKGFLDGADNRRDVSAD